MVAVAGRWMCGLCRERALGDQIPAGEKRFRMSSYVPDYTKWIVALTILAVVLRLSLAMWIRHESSRPMPRKPAPVPAETEEAPPKKKLLDA